MANNNGLEKNRILKISSAFVIARRTAVSYLNNYDSHLSVGVLKLRHTYART
jgi:hypothetical protein